MRALSYCSIWCSWPCTYVQHESAVILQYMMQLTVYVCTTWERYHTTVYDAADRSRIYNMIALSYYSIWCSWTWTYIQRTIAIHTLECRFPTTRRVCSLGLVVKISLHNLPIKIDASDLSFEFGALIGVLRPMLAFVQIVTYREHNSHWPRT